MKTTRRRTRKSATRRWFEKHEYLKNKKVFKRLRSSIPAVQYLSYICKNMPIEHVNAEFMKYLKGAVNDSVGFGYIGKGLESTTDAYDTVWFELISILDQRGADI